MNDVLYIVKYYEIPHRLSYQIGSIEYIAHDRSGFDLYREAWQKYHNKVEFTENLLINLQYCFNEGKGKWKV